MLLRREAWRGLEELHSEIDAFARAGYSHLRCSAAEGRGLDELRALLSTNVSVLVGQSGVGKSSLVRALLPETEVATGGLMREEEGRHTTTASRAYELSSTDGVSGGTLIDSPGVRDFARRTLLGRGHRVIEAASGRMALQIWERHRREIEVLFTDVVMPDGVNGLDLAQQLRTDKPALKVIYASGYSAEVAGGDFSGRQGLDFIAKPYAPADLIRMVDRAMSN